MPSPPPGTRVYPRYDDHTASTSRRRGARSSRLAEAKQRRRRRRTAVAVLLIVAVVLVGAALIMRGMRSGRPATAAPPAVTSTPGPPTAPASATPSASAGPQLTAPGDVPQSGPGTWVYGTTQGAVLGTAGTLRPFRIAIETGAPEDMAAFAARIDQTLGDQRSWIGGRQLRLQRVPANANAEFTIYLATAETTRKLCAADGLDIRNNGQPYTSCRTAGKVILNLTRWMKSVPDFVSAGVPLDIYRDYMINHETGHEFGYNHELCPGPGKPAPVMQTQTLALKGCVANPWPYLNGKRYAGAPAPF